MKRKLLFFIIVISLFSANAFAGVTGQITGTIVDDNGNPVPFATIMLEGTKVGTQADENGYFHLLQAPAGTHTVVVSMIGFATTKMTGVQVQADLDTNLGTITLSEEIVKGKEVVVVAQKELINIEAPAQIKTTGAEEIEMNVVDDIDDIINNAPGVVDGHFRGGRDDQVAYNLDGVSINNPITGGKAIEPPTTMLEAVDVMTGAYSAEYGDAISGVVNAVIKSGSDKLSIDAGGSIMQYASKYNQEYEIELVDTAATVITDTDSNLVLSKHTEGKNINILRKEFFANIGGPLFSENIRFFVGFEGKIWPGAVPDLPSHFDEEDDYGVRHEMNYRVFDISHQDGADSSSSDFSTTNWLKDYRTQDPEAYIRLYEKYIVGAETFIDNEMYTLASKISFYPDPKFRINLSWQYGLDDYMGHREDKLMLDQETDRYNFRYMPFSYARDKTESNIFAMGLTYTINDKAFLDAKATYAIINRNYGGYDYDKDEWMEPGYLEELPTGKDTLINCDYWGVQDGGYTNLGDFYKYFWHSGTYPRHEDQESKTLGVTTDLTWQVNKINRVKTGFKLDFFDAKHLRIINPNPFAYDVYFGNGSGRDETNWELQPIKLAYYITNTLKYEGMILNAGVRVENFSPQGEMWNDPLFPDQGTKDTDSKFTVSPRISISHPITDKSVFSFNYAHLYQSPSMDLLFRNYLKTFSTTESGYTLGNANLDQEKSVVYEIGYDQQIGDNMLLKTRLFYKELNNMVSLRTLYPSVVDASLPNQQTAWYNTFYSKDFGSVRGIEITFEKTQLQYDFWGLWLSYTYSQANGSAGDPFENWRKNEYFIDKREVPLSYDRQHSLIGNIFLTIPDGTFGNRFLDEWNATINPIYMSGLPYTKTKLVEYGQGGAELENMGDTHAERMPDKFRVDMKISKSFNLFSKISSTFYIQVENLFDRENPIDLYETTGEYQYAEYVDAADDYYAFLQTAPTERMPQSVFWETYQQYTTETEFRDWYRQKWMRDLRMQTPDNYEMPRRIKAGLKFSFN